jgi:RND superfamily putative drug exporter
MSPRPARLVEFALTRPKTVLAAWLVIIAIAAVFAIQLDHALTAGGFSDPRSQSATTQTLIQRAFGDEPNQSLVVLEGKRTVTREDIATAERVLRDNGATSIADPQTNPSLASSDGRAVVLAAGFPGSNASVQNKTPAIQAGLDRAVSIDAYLTGQPALDYELNAHSKDDATRAELIAFPVLLVVLLFVFRSLAATILPLVMAGSALAVSEAVGYLATRFTDISILYTNIVSMVGLAVAIDYSLFIVKRYREELDHGADVGAALRTAFSTAGRSVLFSGIAVAVALVALFIPGLMAFTSIALGGIVVTVVAILLSLSALPAVLALLGQRISWGTLPSRRRASRTVPVPRSRASGYGVSIAAGLVAAAALIGIASPALGISLQSPVASATILPAGDSAQVGLDIAQQHVGNHDLFPIQIVITTPTSTKPAPLLREVAAITHYAATRSETSSASSVTTAGVPTATLAQFIATTGTVPSALRSSLATHGGNWVARVVVTAADGPDSVAAHHLVLALRAQVHSNGYTIAVTGATAQGLDFDTTLERSIPWIIGFVFVLTFVMLLFAFRSVVLPLLALAFNSLVVSASLGVLTMVTHLITRAPINSVTPVLLFAVMFGLSMDYMVIIISRVIEVYRSGLSFDNAVTVGTTKTRAMINSAAIIMVAVFASFTSAQISIVREIGIGLGVAVILDALVIRMLVMPAVLRLIGHRILPTPQDTSGRRFRNAPVAPSKPRATPVRARDV